MADEARLNELLDLVEQARAEGDSATEQKAIAAYRRESSPAAPPQFAPPSMGGAGGLSAMLSTRLGNTAERAAERELGATRENANRNPIIDALGLFEPAIQGVTGLGGMAAGGLAGIGQGVKNLVSPGMPAGDRVQRVQQAMTYQPRTATGNIASRVVGLPGEAWSAGTNKAGEVATDVTGLPSLGAAIKTAGDVAPSVIGMRGAAKGGPRGGADYKPTRLEVPTTEQLTQASRVAYKVGKESGVVVPADGYSRALMATREVAKAEGIDPTLHPKSSAVMRRLEEAEGKELSLQEAETLRKIALDAEDDLNPVTRQPTPDARLAGKLVDELDEQIDALSVNSPARALWARSRRSQMIDQAIHRAEIKAGATYTQAGMETALRNEFKTLALNPRRMRGLTAEQKAAIEKVAKGGNLENSLRQLGKFDPTGGFFPAAAGIASGAAAIPTGGISLLLPAAGFAAKRGATAMTARNVEKARESLVGRGLPSVVQPSRGAPTLPNAVPQGSLGGPRTPANIRADIARLQSRASNLPRGTRPDSPEARMLFQELSVLSEELARAEGGMRASQ